MKYLKLYAIAIMWLFVVLQISSAITLKEMFPVTPFAMYAGSYSSKDIQMLRITCVPAEPAKEFYLAELDRFQQEADYVARIDGNIPEQAPLILDPLAKDLEGDCKFLRLYQLSWHEFTGPTRNNPDKKELLYETKAL
ncbi:MAG: hypothetical protein JSU04_09230 [Bdellovibrionales bacterium]|nr:hypothetical protein [Bdellovibrionales bacterium]